MELAIVAGVMALGLLLLVTFLVSLVVSQAKELGELRANLRHGAAALKAEQEEGDAAKETGERITERAGALAGAPDSELDGLLLGGAGAAPGRHAAPAGGAPRLAPEDPPAL